MFALTLLHLSPLGVVCLFDLEFHNGTWLLFNVLDALLRLYYHTLVLT